MSEFIPDEEIFTLSSAEVEKFFVNTWDKFYLPKPFGKIVINISPVYDSNQEHDLASGVSKYMVECENMASEKIK